MQAAGGRPSGAAVTTAVLLRRMGVELSKEESVETDDADPSVKLMRLAMVISVGRFGGERSRQRRRVGGWGQSGRLSELGRRLECDSS